MTKLLEVETTNAVLTVTNIIIVAVANFMINRRLICFSTASLRKLRNKKKKILSQGWSILVLNILYFLVLEMISFRHKWVLMHIECDLLDMPVVAQLEKDGNHALIYELLKIFLIQRLDAYLEFHSANYALLKTYGVVHEDSITKMRLMSLADLGSNDLGSIPYYIIKDTLQVTDDEAIGAKIFDCKMDQTNQIVIVSRCTERVFAIDQWESLKAKLVVWRVTNFDCVNAKCCLHSGAELAAPEAPLEDAAVGGWELIENAPAAVVAPSVVLASRWGKWMTSEYQY